MTPRYLFFGLVFVVCGCSKGFLNVNSNPNAPSSGAPSLIFTNAEAFTATIINGNGGSGFGDFFNLNYPMSYEALSSNYQVAYNITRNNYTSTDFAGVWTDIYHNLNDYLQVGEGASGEPFLAAGAKVMEALDYQMLVDGYGDIPYSQALQLPQGVTNPSYDNAQAVYNACLGKLDSAIAIFESDSVTANGSYNPGNADIIFQGSPASWVQLANTLKLRLLLHEVTVSSQASTIQAEAAKIAADPNGCLGAGQTAFVNPGYAKDAASHLNPLWSTMGYSITGALANADQSANSYFMAKLASYNDPRVGFFYLCDPSTGQPSGNPFGIPTNASATYVGSGPQVNASTNSIVYPYNVSTSLATWGILQGATQKSILVSSWESLFLQAEAIERGLLPGGDAAAEAAYQSAITDHFTYLSVYTNGTVSAAPSTFAAAYYGQALANVGWTSSPDKIQAIITQKYISLCFTNAEEAWTDFRRTGFPGDLPLSTDPAALYPRVLRFIYPQSEYDSNKDNVEKEGTVSPVSPKIFWMP
ncbi:SusD/RagB family nutrient-binding outer membrane lipoprotein [Dinghuibacter silviterrae]|uniref:SusD-like starch-binding protein associating with outer membrane n=1 Tax=Dinghuibacter silviterrae TaxID=1539049 RepID=A0A4R8DE08_9BACT|nr:SusD/RagB family nutrient-binding outer membrane lipoprotein [Dinghuibacter silviterrae]TDW95721.1 SusD-like starch-binding protein associating with outer membrane [Dinghuibacter silviterrae]